MNQVGEAEWNRLNEREKQRKLMEIKMQERRLREEGKIDEAKELLKGLVEAELGTIIITTTTYFTCLFAKEIRSHSLVQIVCKDLSYS